MGIAVRQTALALVTVVLGVNAPAGGQTRDDETDIRRAVEAMAVAFNTQDDQATMDLATPDADFVLASGVWSKGVNEYVASRRARAGTVLKNARVRLIDTKIRFLRADVALVHVLHEISGMSDASGRDPSSSGTESPCVRQGARQVVDHRLPQYPRDHAGEIARARR